MPEFDEAEYDRQKAERDQLDEEIWQADEAEYHAYLDADDAKQDDLR
ncbi:hypothetical protein ABZ891_12645 [Streptomyces sp. NPDC047023]